MGEGIHSPKQNTLEGERGNTEVFPVCKWEEFQIQEGELWKVQSETV